MDGTLQAGRREPRHDGVVQRRDQGPVVLCAPDKMRGTLDGPSVASAMADGARRSRWQAVARPLSDGGEGFGDVLAFMGGTVASVEVSGPLGDAVVAPLRLVGERAVVESAAASGLELAGGRPGNDAMRASSRGTGQLVAEAVRRGAHQVVVGVGGSASTDGGAGAVEAIEQGGGLRGAELIVACDVDVPFVDAAELFGPQKGATEAQVPMLRRRLEELRSHYLDSYGIDVGSLPYGGAAGGLAGGLAALGASLVSGFDYVADAVGLDELIDKADAVITAEGKVDAGSWSGKVVGGVVDRARRHHRYTVVIGGTVIGGPDDVELIDLSQRFGIERATGDTYACVAETTAEVLARLSG